MMFHRLGRLSPPSGATVLVATKGDGGNPPTCFDAIYESGAWWRPEGGMVDTAHMGDRWASMESVMDALRAPGSKGAKE
jgi:hypothetical protein